MKPNGETCHYQVKDFLPFAFKYGLRVLGCPFAFPRPLLGLIASCAHHRAPCLRPDRFNPFAYAFFDTSRFSHDYLEAERMVKQQSVMNMEDIISTVSNRSKEHEVLN